MLDLLPQVKQKLIIDEGIQNLLPLISIDGQVRMPTGNPEDQQ
jgi:hypothetical protein